MRSIAGPRPEGEKGTEGESMIHSYLLAGQSNMAGRGFLKEAAPILDPDILVLRNGRWLKMYEPVICDRPFSGVGPAASFAWAWRKDHPDGRIGLIPAADGGSRLREWAPGSALFDHAAYQCELASRISRIEGILWHQGESDCDDVAHYEEKFLPILEGLRKAAGDASLPVLIGGLGDYLPACPLHDYFVHGPEMNACLKSIAGRYENCYFVTAEGLMPNPDGLHFSAASQRIFGVRYYEALKTRADVEKPLPGEDKLLAEMGSGTAAPGPEERAEQLKKAFSEGRLNRQEYNHYMADLIKEM